MTGDGVAPEASPRRGRGGRTLVLLLVLASAAAVAWLALRGPRPDPRSARDEVLDLDRRALEAYRRAHAEWRPGSGALEFEAVIERTVLPLFRRARRTLDELETVPEEDRDLVRALRAFVDAREAAYAAQAAAMARPDGETVVAAKTRMAEADRLRAEIDALGHR